jgi:SAM-dependent methyltransferase
MDLRERECPICGVGSVGREYYPARIDESRLDKFAFASRKLPEYMHYRLIQCSTCDLLYASPAPTAEALKVEYEQAAYDSNVEATFAAATYGHYLAERILPKLTHRRGAVDVGTGNGAFLSELVAHGFTEVCGVEPSAAPIAVADPAIRPLIRHGIFKASDFAPASLSLISCFQTIEHVPDPLKLARDMFSLLRPGGVAYLVSHNYRSLQAKILRERSPILDVEHLQLFSPRSLQQMFANAGFEQAVVFPIANRYPLNYWVRLLPLPGKSKSALVDRLKGARAGRLPIPLRAGNLATFAIKP